MDLTKTCYGNWSGGRFMHFGEMVSEERYLNMIRHAYEKGMRTFITADVYGGGKADEMLGQALADYPRDSYCLVGTIGHDFYKGERQGSSGYPRFTHPDLHSEREYTSYLRMACEKSLERCGTNHFDLVMLHNPDETGYTNDTVWEGMRRLKEEGLAERLGVAPGPANGFTLDLLHCFERFGEVLDWAMIILNPLEPWPGQQVLGGAEKNDIKILTRVIDYGGVFHDDMKPGHEFRPGDHRAYRPAGWVENGCEKMEKMRPLAEKYGLSMLQFAAIWNLSQKPVASVVPTFIQEAGDNARPVEDKIDDLAALPEDVVFTPEEVEAIRKIGDNTGCMALKGASQRHEGPCERPDEWPMRDELLELADAHGVGRDW
ncbi:aldo/keto reductase [Roseibacillus persicicus]|uniref:aldo/keto reductase n=1 Tax=Roseibacillus persicicus TaxID=454148 RepID=UPI00398B4F9E